MNFISPIWSFFLAIVLLASVQAQRVDTDKPAISFPFPGGYTITTPKLWTKNPSWEIWQVGSPDLDQVLSATAYEDNGDWKTFWKTRTSAVPPGLKSTGTTHIIDERQTATHHHPLAIMREYEGTVEGKKVVFFAIALKCSNHFVSANFVTDREQMKKHPELERELLRSISRRRPKAAESK